MAYPEEHAEKRLSRGGYRCRNCNTAFFAETVIDVTVEEWFGQMQMMHCPNCKASYHMLTIGLGLSLSEDRARRKGASLDERVADWLAEGETGTSSLAIHAYMTKTAQKDGAPAPRDVDDLRRCVLLLDRIPEWTVLMPDMAVLEQWSKIAPRWSELDRTYRAESPDLKGSAPKTAALLAELEWKSR